MRFGVVVALAAAAACGKRSQCELDADAMARLLAEAYAEPAAAFIESSDELVARPELPIIHVKNWGSDIRLTAHGIDLDGRAVADKEELGARLPTSALASQASRDAGAVHLYVAPSVPWAQVVDAVTAASRAGYDAPMFVFRGPPQRGTAPPRTAMDSKLDAASVLPSHAKIAELAKLMTDVAKSCPALARVLAEPEKAFSIELIDGTLRSIPTALVECGCAVDLPSLRSLMWFLLWNQNPSRVIAFEHGAPADTTIALPANTPWSEANKQLAPGMRKAKLLVR